MKRSVWVILAGAAIVMAAIVVISRPPARAIPEPPVFSARDDADPEVARAIASATDAVHEDRSNRLRWVTLAMVYQANRMLTEAAECYEQALSMGAKDTKTWYYLAVVRSGRGELDGAVEAMRRSIAINGSHGPSHRRLGEWLIDFDELDEAQREFERAIELDANDLRARIGLSRLALRANRLEEAREILQRVIELPDGQIPPAFQLLGTVYQRMGQPERALRLVRQSRTTTSTYRDAWLNDVARHQAGQPASLAKVKQLVLERRFDKALELLLSLDDLYPNEAVISNNLGVVYRALGRLAASTREFQRAKLRNDAYFKADYNIAMNYVMEAGAATDPTRATLLQSAQQHLDRVFTINASYGPAVGLHAILLREFGNLELAASRYQEAARLEPARPKWMHSAAVTLHELGRNEEALELLNQLLTSAPNFVQAYVVQAYAYAALGQMQEAEQALLTAVRMQPDLPTIPQAIRELNLDVQVPTPYRDLQPNGPGN